MESVKYQCKNVVASGHTTTNMSRMALLKWINELLGTRVQKVEALCSGAVYCQIMDMLFPGCISLKKVKFEATQTTEFWTNLKQLQIAFRAVGCEKEILIDTLIKGRFQDNFEFLQWFKRFYDANSEASSCAPIKSKPAGSEPQSTSKVQQSRFMTTISDRCGQQERDIKTQIDEYQDKAEKITEEKDFYFNKLRNIEILCTTEDAAVTDKETLVNQILAELYATADGFEPPEGEE